MRGAGVALGLAGAACALAVWSVPASSRVGDMDLGVQLGTSGALRAGTNQVMQSRMVRPGRPAVSTFTVRNSGGVPVGVRMRTTGPPSEMDPRLVVRLDAGTRRIYDGTLGGLRRPSALRFGLRSGETRKIRLTIGIRPGLTTGFAGHYERLTLELQEEEL